MPGDTTVLILMLLAYALAVLLGSLVMLDAQRRRSLQQRVQRFGSRMASGAAGAGSLLQRSSTQTQLRVQHCADASKSFIARHRWHATAAVFMLVFPVTVVLILQPSRSLPGYDERPVTSDRVILALLRGEQLAPPPAMPPEAFITPEVEAVRQNLAGASREWMALDADFRQRLLTIFHLMAQKGYPMALLEGYRSPARQAYLASLGSHVTSAGAYQSFHQFGLAADSAFVRDGKLVISEKDQWAMQGYRLYGELAESVGLVWGGRWKMMDFGHVELRRPGTVMRSAK